MDHLPPIVEHSYAAPEIPCLCQPQDYDGKGLFGFPERVGWKIDSEHGPLPIGDNERSISSPAALLQLWLYFGLLYDIFRIANLDIEWERYVQFVDGEVWVTSVLLREDLDTLKAKDIGVSQDLCHRRQELAADCLRIVFRLFHEYYPAPFRPKKWAISSILSPDLSNSIIVLAETLTNALGQIWPLPPDSAPLKRVNSHVSWNPLQDRFKERGWCPSEIKMLYQEVDKTGLFLASLVKRPFSQNLQHENCNESECLALQISDNHYETKHIDGCPRDLSCSTISIDQGTLSRILFSGGIPILHISPSPETAFPKVQVIDRTAQNIDYIAISHVWAHGLGNPDENALPSCQLHRLTDLCSNCSPAVGKRTAFWIDTLCIPVGIPSARKVAIRQLSSTFRLASKVLVLDADLQRTSKRCSRTELATRIMCCGWMRRLWTLQEAVMGERQAEARKVKIWFRDGALEYNAVGGGSVNSFHNTEDALSKLFFSIPQFMSRDRAFNSLMSALRYRTTSKKEDEALCVASILGFDQQQITAIAGEDTTEAKMQKMYTFIGHIPASTLFNRSRKLGEKGFAWAPASLLGSGNYLDFFDGQVAKCDEQGLHVQFAGYIIREKTSQPSSKEVRTQIFLATGEEEKYSKCKIAPPLTADMHSYYKGTINFDKMMGRTEIPAVIINPRSASESVLVSVTQEIGDTIHATFLMQVYARLWPEGTKFEGREYNNWKKNYMRSREAGVGQRWCVR